jgi:hypothetical protein
MGKRPARRALDPTTAARLRAVGPYDLVTDPGYCEIHFGRTPELASGLGEFGLSWFVAAPGRETPAPADGLFALWERYRAAHAGLCAEYQRLLFDLFSRSAAAGYDDRRWQQLRRARPSAQDMRGVVSAAEVRLEQRQAGGESAPEYDARVAFVVFWDAHGVAVPLRESAGGFVVGEWSGIGDL